ncbi:holo-ACP synthase [Candidatus Pelagibacter sp. HIMB1509]|uniref:holo-ACP synthase n=1 Tax=Candidatus Pelagibacter sp. HIMB1509 TaxID=3413339 RepID=UPI003F8290E3
MKILGIGVDIIENKRVKEAIKNKSFINRVYSVREQRQSNLVKNKVAFFSKRFAAKEAFAKALGTGFRMKLNFKDIEVVNDKMGKPNYATNKKITKMIKNKFKIKKYNCFLSISDEKKYSTAFAIIQS